MILLRSGDSKKCKGHTYGTRFTSTISYGVSSVNILLLIVMSLKFCFTLDFIKLVVFESGKSIPDMYDL